MSTDTMVASHYEEAMKALISLVLGRDSASLRSCSAKLDILYLAIGAEASSLALVIPTMLILACPMQNVFPFEQKQLSPSWV